MKLLIETTTTHAQHVIIYQTILNNHHFRENHSPFLPCSNFHDSQYLETILETRILKLRIKTSFEKSDQLSPKSPLPHCLPETPTQEAPCPTLSLARPGLAVEFEG
jgi:hypothetical protein